MFKAEAQNRKALDLKRKPWLSPRPLLKQTLLKYG